MYKNLPLFKSFSVQCILDCMIKVSNTMILKRIEFRELKHKRNNNFQVWEKDAHHKQLTSVDAVVQKIEYIHLNPVYTGFMDYKSNSREICITLFLVLY